MFKGSIPALVTPMRDGSVDEASLTAYVEWLVDEGSHGLAPVGTTGESPTLTHDEHKHVVELTVEAAAGRVPVVAGAGSNSTAEAVAYVEHAEKAGANGVLVVTPYYNKPSQKGLYEHYAAVARATSLPVVVYNIPPRSVIDLADETLARLADEFDNIRGIKDATANLVRISRERELISGEFTYLSGEDPTALGYMAHGGHGCISVTANVAPKLCSEFQEACMAGDFSKALTYQDRLMPLHRALFLEPSPAPVKYALSALGKMAPTVRAPITEVEESTRREIESAMRHAGLLN